MDGPVHSLSVDGVGTGGGPVSYTHLIDLCVCESAHITPENTLDKLMRCRFGRLVFNHLHEKWHGEGEQTLYDSYKSVPYPIQIGHDGDVLEL